MLMVVIVFMWGYEYVPAKHALDNIDPIVLVLLKYSIALLCLLPFKLKLEGKKFVEKRDLPLFVICAIFGEILYFWGEYTAMNYMPVALISIILSTVPIFSVLTERIFYKIKASYKIYGGIVLSIFGISLTVGADFSVLLEGRIMGYLMAFLAVISWNIYNFLTKKLSGDYRVLTLTTSQVLITIIITAPIAYLNMPPATAFTGPVVGGIIYLGVVSAAIGFYMYIRALSALGPTATTMFSNFLPITAALFSWMLLEETIVGIQIIGGLIVVAAGSLVIKEKGRIEDLANEQC